MSTDLLNLISQFRPFDDRETTEAYYRTRVPWVAPEAYLNLVYKSAPSGVLAEVATKWRFPSSLVKLLEQHNGAMLFSGALNLYGVVSPGRFLNREDSLSLPPFNIEWENKSWSLHPERLLVVGGYTLDGSRVCVDRSDGKAHVFQRSQRAPMASWPSLESWILDEVARLRLLFDDEGKRVGPEAETGPPNSTRLPWQPDL
jgi:hypothetical protein